MSYTLHYAPDNASLIIRLALEYRGLPYTTQLVDRAAMGQNAPDYLALNPLGLIPVLETPQGPIFETGAILLWLADTHGGLGPAPDAPQRAAFLKWLFFAANTLHPALRMIFYPEKYIAPSAAPDLRAGLARHFTKSLAMLEQFASTSPSFLGGPAPTVLDFYCVALVRWPALYPQDQDRDWFDLAATPHIARIAASIEALPCTSVLQKAEGLGMTPFTAPQHPNPPIGSAT